MGSPIHTLTAPSPHSRSRNSFKTPPKSHGISHPPHFVFSGGAPNSRDPHPDPTHHHLPNPWDHQYTRSPHPHPIHTPETRLKHPRNPMGSRTPHILFFDRCALDTRDPTRSILVTPLARYSCRCSCAVLSRPCCTTRWQLLCLLMIKKIKKNRTDS